MYCKGREKKRIKIYFYNNKNNNGKKVRISCVLCVKCLGYL